MDNKTFEGSAADLARFLLNNEMKSITMPDGTVLRGPFKLSGYEFSDGKEVCGPTIKLKYGYHEFTDETFKE